MRALFVQVSDFAVRSWILQCAMCLVCYSHTYKHGVQRQMSISANHIYINTCTHTHWQRGSGRVRSGSFSAFALAHWLRIGAPLWAQCRALHQIHTCTQLPSHTNTHTYIHSFIHTHTQASKQRLNNADAARRKGLLLHMHSWITYCRNHWVRLHSCVCMRPPPLPSLTRPVCHCVSTCCHFQQGQL